MCSNVTIDWTVRNNVRVEMRVLVKRIQYHWTAGEGYSGCLDAGRSAVTGMGSSNLKGIYSKIEIHSKLMVN
ncbi:hypothetical protein [uncultured Methanomethylovorans sp.]|uniref:hypothetical protein n=1 Tax=uncultured Methanomethylovorans sp. TaxID=183759 RepID=UPI002AA8F93D|nr:hypothetical protein [uncultured Methanomethylovorans sp.]